MAQYFSVIWSRMASKIIQNKTISISQVVSAGPGNVVKLS